MTFDELERELRLVEESIAQLSASDAFAEDLIARHAYRKTLLAALAERPQRRAQRIASLAWQKVDATGEDDDDALSRSAR
jgi:hypothetical protein